MTPPLLITGASGYTGRRLVRRLVERGDTVRLLLRESSETEWLADLDVQPEIVHGDLEDESSVSSAFAGMGRVIHLAHIRYARVVAHAHTSNQRIVFISSLRALSTVPCPSVDEVLQGERDAATVPGAVVLRPSMIYGPGDDRNLSRLADWLSRHRWVPTIGAQHLHQPVHVDDVVEAIIAAIDGTETGLFAIAGPAPLSYADLVEHVGRSVGVKPWLVRMPAAPLVGGMKIWRALRLPAPVEVSQVQRLLEDKAYDITPARQKLGFSPRSLASGLQASEESVEARACC